MQNTVRINKIPTKGQVISCFLRKNCSIPGCNFTIYQPGYQQGEMMKYSEKQINALSIQPLVISLHREHNAVILWHGSSNRIWSRTKDYGLLKDPAASRRVKAPARDTKVLEERRCIDSSFLGDAWDVKSQASSKDDKKRKGQRP